MAVDLKNNYNRFFGLKLNKCDSFNKKENVFDSFETVEVLKNDSIVIGVYFSFANVCEEFTKSLVNFYERINDKCEHGKKFEVIQVVLWSNNDVFSDVEQNYRDNIIDLPWFAIPFSEIEKKTRLTRRYNIKSGVPSLVLLDAADCATITVLARDRLLEDPEGAHFPWRPRPVDQVLRDIKLLKAGLHCTVPDDNTDDLFYSGLDDAVVRGFYFSAHWCPPCRAFTPQLINTCKQIRKRGMKFEIVFVSSDRSLESYNMYTKSMPWLCVSWQQEETRRELAALFGVQGIPALVLVDANGHVITDDGRAEVIDDPDGLNFPWKPRSVNILTERYATKMHDYPAIVLFIEGEDSELQFAESVLTPVAENYYKQHNIIFTVPPQDDDHDNCEESDHCLQFLIGLDSETSDILREFVGLDDAIPLLTAVNIPERKYAFLEYGVEINVHSVRNFVDQFLNGGLEMLNIKLRDRLPKENE